MWRIFLNLFLFSFDLLRFYKSLHLRSSKYHFWYPLKLLVFVGFISFKFCVSVDFNLIIFICFDIDCVSFCHFVCCGFESNANLVDLWILFGFNLYSFVCLTFKTTFLLSSLYFCLFPFEFWRHVSANWLLLFSFVTSQACQDIYVLSFHVTECHTLCWPPILSKCKRNMWMPPYKFRELHTLLHMHSSYGIF